MKRKFLILPLLVVLLGVLFSTYMVVVAKQHWIARKHVFTDLCQSFSRDRGRPPSSIDEVLDHGDPQFRSGYLSNPVRFPFVARERTFAELEYPVEISGETLVIGESSGVFGLFAIPEIRIDIGVPDRSSGLEKTIDRSSERIE